MSDLQFVKMHGCGNDYIYIDGFAQRDLTDDAAKLGELSRRVADRRKGIGADGLILILPSQRAQVRMRMFNADGSEGNMCGNGIRCVAKYAYDAGIVRDETMRIESKVDVHRVTLQIEKTGREMRAVGARVDMGIPEFTAKKIPIRWSGLEAVDAPLEVSGTRIRFTAVSMGNPHCVMFMEADDATFERLGPTLERHPTFPDRANVEFVEMLAPDELRVRVWERGSGETFACGTGACAAVAAAVRTDRGKRKAKVHLRGGTLEIDWQQGGRLFMTGPAEEICRGTVSRALIEGVL